MKKYGRSRARESESSFHFSCCASPLSLPPPPQHCFPNWSLYFVLQTNWMCGRRLVIQFLCHLQANIPLNTSSSLSDAASWSILNASASKISSDPDADSAALLPLGFTSISGFCFIGEMWGDAAFDSDTTDLVGVMWEDKTFWASWKGLWGERLVPSEGWPLTPLPVDCYKTKTE